MSDIVERLRNVSGWPGDHGDVVLCTDAAEEIEGLRQREAELWRTVSDMKAAAETAGYVFRNTDSGPALVR